MGLKNFSDIKDYLYKQKRTAHLLLGNGFSIAYNDKIFSYNALSQVIEDSENDLVKQLFSRTNTKNFELLMRLLEDFSNLSDIFGIEPETNIKIMKAHDDIQKALIDAVTKLHPDYVFDIPEAESKRCFSFLTQFLDYGGHVFSTNYDLLLYWVLMRNLTQKTNAIDGFSRNWQISHDTKHAIPGIHTELCWGKYKSTQNIHYLHGALPLFRTRAEIIKEEYDMTSYILEKIKARIEKNQYPIFVTAGDGSDKLRQIVQNRYLSFCYERLSAIEGSLITYGFGFGEYDEHIIEAINKAATKGKEGQLWSIYIGVFSEGDIRHIESIKEKFKCKVHIFDAKTANIWR